ncbi:hypothetical protein PSEUBRA_000381 [Kalmanozyma brasiliensis GHG001]|uniref:Mitochondrial sodium/hydrogen exchanger n=1 Tax=Kalmanozyma brasiliensis (strain GHG001) TaxID=1365824 RepID=V5EHB5_KALBG|nr:uncharacterized protein PSEUBRA_000381 [Kalmanozyma brasiliensis GHG001]EST09981.1 hypothetical protein PSEUBRA_000381 [Kalmanozyma brasiliensis GHG001]
MAQLPPYLVRIVATMLTQALTRKLANSPLFFRIVDRMIHEIDHMPHRVQGRQVPTYQPPLGMRESEWDQDHGEPHNEPSPFPVAKGKQAGAEGAQGEQKMTFEEAQRHRARMSYQQSQRLAQRQREKAKAEQQTQKQDTVSNELKELQDKLRELRNKS